MWFVLPVLVLAVVAIVAGTSVERRLTAAREAVHEAELREAAVLRELATAKRAAAQAEADLQFLLRFVRELPHVAHEMHARAGGRHVASLLLSTVVRLLEPKKALVAVARRSPGGDGARALAVVAVSPEGCMPLGIPINVGKGEIGFAVEVQRVMDRKDFDAQPAATRRRLREQTGTDCQPDLVAPLVFNDEAVGVIAIEGPKRSSLEIKDALRLIAHIGAAALYTGARYSEINKTVVRAVQGFEADEGRLAMEAIARVGPGGNFVQDPHTMKYLRVGERYKPSPLIYRGSRDGWMDEGGKNFEKRANEIARGILKEHEVLPLPEDTARALDELVADAMKQLK